MNIENGYDKEEMGNGLNKLKTDDDIFYWIEKNGTIEIVTQMHETRSGLYIELTGKLKSSSAHASDFYQMILQSAKRLIFSGDTLSNEGFGIWKRLIDDGKKLFVYDTNNPENRSTISSEEDLNKFLGNTQNYKKYRYVLSESKKEHSSTLSSFDLLIAYNLTFGFKN
jgi:hypothetical protein